MRNKLIWAVGLLGLCTPTLAQTEVSNYTPGVTLDGVTYCLPRTALRFIVTAEKAEFTPGEFAKYADRYLRQQSLKNSSTTWKLKNISMEAYGVPDPDKQYSIRLKGRTVAPLVQLTPEGILLAINTTTQPETLSEVPQRIPAAKPQNAHDYMNQEMLSAGSTAKMADLVAQEIYEIRDSRNALIRGEADNTPKDGAQLKLMLNRLDEEEQALMSLFKGTTQTSTEVFVIDYVPEKADEKLILFRFSKQLGVVDNDDLAGAPVYLSLRNLQTVAEPVLDEKTAKKKAKMETGVYYNVPGRVALQVESEGQPLIEAEVQMGQFGNVEVLSDVLFDKKTTTNATFFSATGGLKKLTAEQPK